MKKLVTLFILLAISTQVWAQKIEVSGTVTDDVGLALPGATVLVKGTTNGMTTDFDGNYKINTNNGAILVFTYVGFITQEVKVASSIINVQLKQGGTLDEVVIVAYRGSVNSSKVASAVVTVESRTATRKEQRRFRRKARKDKKDAQNGTNNILNGAVSGVQVTSGNAQTIQIAGRSSLHNGNIAQTSSTNKESYKEINENIFKRTSLAPLSTFSIDVDKAAYSNIRRMINNGQKVPIDAVKIEEMINYFEYNYTQPIDAHPFAVHTEVGVTPWNKDTKLLKIALKGKEIPLAEIPPSNFTFLIDVSGSMSAQNKLPLLKSAFKLMVAKMRPEDKVAIVVYAGAAGLVLEPTSGDNKQKIVNALNNLKSGGSTAGGQGIELAYKIAVENFIKDGNNRVIMATDGDFNVGQTSTASMEKLIEEKRKSGVFLSVLGFGMGNYKHDKLEALADKGNGNHAYIDTMQEAYKIFGKEFGGTLYTIAKDVKLQLEFNPNIVQGYRLIGYENRLLADEDFKDDTKDAGELGAGHTVTALYEIIPVSVETEYLKSVDDLKYTETTTSSESFTKELLTVKLRYKKPNEDKSQELKTVVENVLTSKLSSDFKFTAAVALFGMQLKDSKFHNNSGIDAVIALAKSGRGEDKSGYRAEFIRLVEATVTK